MKKRTTYDDLARMLDRINTAAKVCGIPAYQIDHGPEGRVRLVDSKGRGVLGASTGLGMASIPKRELLQRMGDYLDGIETAYLATRRTSTEGVQA